MQGTNNNEFDDLKSINEMGFSSVVQLLNIINDNNEKSTSTNKNGTVRTESHLPISKNNTKSTAKEKDNYNVDIGDSGR